jgi:hypothetical protein
MLASRWVGAFFCGALQQWDFVELPPNSWLVGATRILRWGKGEDHCRQPRHYEGKESYSLLRYTSLHFPGELCSGLINTRVLRFLFFVSFLSLEP